MDEQPLTHSDPPIETENSADSPPKQAPKASFREMTVLISIAAISIVLDQWTKGTVRLNLDINTIFVPYPTIEPYFRITHVVNKGAAFSIFQNGGPIFLVLGIIVSIGILYYNFFELEGHQRLMRIALGLQLGGAVGNLLDRVRFGHVTDFIDVGSVPIFNIADTSIVCGAIVLGFMVLREYIEERKSVSYLKNEQEPMSSR